MLQKNGHNNNSSSVINPDCMITPFQWPAHWSESNSAVTCQHSHFIQFTAK